MKKIYISLLSFTLVTLLFTTATFAFFSVAHTSSIDGLSFAASSGDELELSFDGIEYYNILPSSPLEKSADGIKLYDVTSLDGINFQTGGLRVVGEAIPNEYYLSFDLWIRTSQAEHDIFLINDVSKGMKFGDKRDGTYFISKGVTWRSPLTFFNGPSINDVVRQGDIGIYYASEALRLSIIELKDENNLNDLRDEADLRVFMYDPSRNPYRGYGATFGQFSYYFQKTMVYVDLPKEIPNVSFRLSEMDPNNPYQALDNESLVATLQPSGLIEPKKNKEYYSGKIRVNVWIEGWDADAFDALDQDLIQIQLQFKAARRAE
ncbi:MAG: hypothetical protein Q7I99_03135 [Acholeplasmataceae bacterium]|nr:hypothetical protein [Acholeplasmataceae bacterium]